LCNQGEPAPKKLPPGRWLDISRHLARFYWHEDVDRGQPDLAMRGARNPALSREVDGHRPDWRSFPFSFQTGDVWAPKGLSLFF
jgi:hypothetical protein